MFLPTSSMAVALMAKKLLSQMNYKISLVSQPMKTSKSTALPNVILPSYGRRALSTLLVLEWKTKPTKITPCHCVLSLTMAPNTKFKLMINSLTIILLSLLSCIMARTNGKSQEGYLIYLMYHPSLNPTLMIIR